MNVYFNQDDGSRVAVEGQELSRSQTQRPPDVEFRRDPKREYYVVMYDNDAPNPAFLHLIMRVDYDTVYSVLVPYWPPTPPAGEHHTYTILLLSGKVRPLSTHFRIRLPSSRKGFSIEQFSYENDLDVETQRTFTCG